MNKREKLVMLADYLNLETGSVITASFSKEQVLYQKSVEMKRIASGVRECRDCPGMNIKGYTEAVAGVGNLNADIVFVGQSLYQHEMASGVPLLLESGYLLDAALKLSGIGREQVYVTNAVKCHVKRRQGPSSKEAAECRDWLRQELQIVSPTLVVAMGVIAQVSVKQVWAGKILNIKHPVSYGYKSAGAEASVGWVIKLSDQLDKVTL